MAEQEKALHTDQMVLNIGPSHPATHGTVRIIATLDGETIVNADVEIGYLHRAFEKSCERGTWQQAFPYTDRLNYNSAIINNVGYAMAVEKLLGVEVPERCQFIRTIASEISRIADHLTSVGPNAMELGAFSAFLYFVEARELMWDLIESLCGARLTNNYVRIGGVKADLPEDFAEKVKLSFARTRELIEDVDKLLTHNRIFIDRMRGTAEISAGEAIDWGWTGPCLRSTGVPLDLRKDAPYMVYDRVDFDVPVGEVGDNFDRYLVRMEEMRQSIRIVEQLVAAIPEGPINVDDTRVRWPAKQLVYTRMEELINHFKIVFEGVTPPRGEAYSAVESPNGELGFYLVSDGTGKPVKVRCRPPCFAIIQALGPMLEGAMLADIVPTFGMINMVGGECDR
ncbi:MAG: NADH dehydrogenase (quinone) subunit D [Myxococcota bacterium]